MLPVSHQWAVMSGDTVANVVLWDGAAWPHDAGSVIELGDDMPIGIGWRLVDGQWIAPPPPPPAPDPPAEQP